MFSRCAAALVVLYAAAGLVTACRPAPAPPKSELMTAWQKVGSWSGRTNVQTESFTSETGSFKFLWTSKSDPGDPPGRLQITLHSAVSGRPLVPAVDHRGDGQDTIYVSEDPREFYVVVEAERTTWTLTVEEGISLLLTPTKR